MMPRRNRKRRRLDNALVPIPLAGLVVLATALGVVYVYLGCRCELLGQDIKRLEIEVEKERDRCAREEYRWAQLTTPANLDVALARHHLPMTWPKPDQIVRLRAETGRAPLVAERRSAGAGEKRIWHE